jgi:uncharacterized metal-binding protein YceD (DUF177 family)
MYIDLAKIDEKGIVIDDTVSFDESYIKKTPIKKLDNIKVKGRAYYSITNEIVFECDVTGVMVLEDSLTLEPVDYPIDIHINEVLGENTEENVKNESKTLDIIDILWQNIVLEVPISLRVNPEKDYDMKGEGWELLKEDD